MRKCEKCEKELRRNEGDWCTECWDKALEKIHSHPILRDEKGRTLSNPDCQRFYWPGCPTCEANREFVNVIAKEGVTQEEHDKAEKKYKEEGEAHKLAVGFYN